MMMIKKWDYVNDSHPHHPVTMETIAEHQRKAVHASSDESSEDSLISPMLIVAFLAIYAVVLLITMLQLPL